MSNYIMTFPDTVEEFMEEYKMVDEDHVYSNGTEYVPIFRMKQWFKHLEALKSQDNALDEWCTDCKEYDAEKHNCPRFNRVIRSALQDADLQPTCNRIATDTVSKQAVINALENTDCELTSEQWDELTNAVMRLPSAEPERKKDVIQKFHDYQIEWLTSHCDLELEPVVESWIVQFLHDTANCYMMEVEHETN